MYCVQKTKTNIECVETFAIRKLVSGILYLLYVPEVNDDHKTNNITGGPDVVYVSLNEYINIHMDKLMR